MTSPSGRRSGPDSTRPARRRRRPRGPPPARRDDRTRRSGVGRRELAGVTGERPALRLVLIAHVHDEGRRGHVVDEVVADRLGLPRLSVGRVAAEARVEDPLGSQPAGRLVVRVAIGPVRHSHHARSGRRAGRHALLCEHRSRRRRRSKAAHSRRQSQRHRARRHRRLVAQPVLAGAAKERKGGIMGAVKAAFRSGPRDHEHQFIEAPGGIGITRYVCEQCGYVSISVGD